MLASNQIVQSCTDLPTNSDWQQCQQSLNYCQLELSHDRAYSVGFREQNWRRISGARIAPQRVEAAVDLGTADSPRVRRSDAALRLQDARRYRHFGAEARLKVHDGKHDKIRHVFPTRLPRQLPKRKLVCSLCSKEHVAMTPTQFSLGGAVATLPLELGGGTSQIDFAAAAESGSIRPFRMSISRSFDSAAAAIVFHGDCVDLLADIAPGSVQLIVTSPPYNIGKDYEKLRGRDLRQYWQKQKEIVAACYRVLSARGSICWQVGNYVDRKNGERTSIYPLDILLYPAFRRFGLKLRNRIVWHFEHGLNCRDRFSGRYETILWYTKTDDYVFNLDPVRVPQKYPGKRAHKGKKHGQPTCNPKGKNPGDLWVIPNVKSNHVEKTSHPCQFPVELVERLVLALTNPGDLVVDPFLGVGSTIIAANRQARRGAGAEIVEDYCKIAEQRILAAQAGTLRVRPMGKPVFDHTKAGKRLLEKPWESNRDAQQGELLSLHETAA
jgi:adenine-specific DNA-methyltransferase